MLLEKPSFRRYAKSCRDYIKGCDLVGYNLLRFDVPVLIMEFERHNTLHPFESCKILDVFKIFCHLNPRNLSACYKHYTGKELKGAHGAEVDTIATAEILDAMVFQFRDDADKYGVEPEMSFDDLTQLGHADNRVDWFGKLKYNDNKEVVFNFGKCKGEVVRDVWIKDNSYIEWLLSPDFDCSNDTKKEIRKACGIL